jgi:hypothetical protein
MQISESHCGPATISMLLSNLGIEVTQEQVAEAGGASSLIELNGMRVDQLALAVRRLAPQVVFYYKDHAALAELVRVVQDHHCPAGVEWQGVFEDEEDEEEEPPAQGPGSGRLPGSAQEPAPVSDILPPDSESEEEDYGHYSLVTRADRRRQALIIADPYKDYFSQARIFTFQEFESRWYDYNEVPDPVTGEPALVEDYHLFFVITRRTALFPRRLGMRTF